MVITDVDVFPLAMPNITEAADGTQDTLLVRVRTNEGIEGWGECDSSPLVSLAAYYCPMSHGNIINIRDSLIGETLDEPSDVQRLHEKAIRRGLDIEQIHHAYSGADVALWDALGKRLKQPVFRLLGDAEAHPKLPYASVLFGDTPSDTAEIALALCNDGFRAAKFGWGPMGQDAELDRELVAAAREGMGPQSEIMIDAGVAWGTDWRTALARAEAFAPYEPTWLEEPLSPDAVREYGELCDAKPAVPIAAGEGSNRVRVAADLLENGHVHFVQIDIGRIGGITAAREVVALAQQNGAVYVNHTFKSNLSLAGSFHTFAGYQDFGYLEFPAAGSDLSRRLASSALSETDDGRLAISGEPGLGVEVDLDVVREYLQPTCIEIGGVRVADVSSLD
jgi:L-alanine-DL-glutamate epimerase-like enolase superfamily enzyme